MDVNREYAERALDACFNFFPPDHDPRETRLDALEALFDQYKRQIHEKCAKIAEEVDITGDYVWPDGPEIAKAIRGEDG